MEGWSVVAGDNPRFAAWNRARSARSSRIGGMLPRIRLPFRGWSMATKRLDRMGYLAEGDDGWPLDPGTDARRGLDPASGRLILVAAGCGPSYGPIFESSVQSVSWPTDRKSVV